MKITMSYRVCLAARLSYYCGNSCVIAAERTGKLYRFDIEMITILHDQRRLICFSNTDTLTFSEKEKKGPSWRIPF